MQTRPSEAGFTLIETLISIFSLALLLSAGGILLTSTLNSNRLVSEQLDRLGALEIASSHLRTDLAGAVPRLIETGTSRTQSLSFYGGEQDRNGVVLGLVRDGWSNPQGQEDRGELLPVEYRVQDGQLVRRIYERPDIARRTPSHDFLLVEGLRDVELSFIAGGVSADEWSLALDGQTPRLPDAVQFDMIFESGERLSQTFLVGGRL